MIKKLYFKAHQEGWFLEAVIKYCDAVLNLNLGFSGLEVKSRGLSAFRDYLAGYAASPEFTSLLAETRRLKADLSGIKYCVTIKENHVRVRGYENETDNSTEVEKTFEKFKQGAGKDRSIKLHFGTGMNHVEAQILDCVARLHPEIFKSLGDYYVRNSTFLDETIKVFDREVQFYMSYLDYIAELKDVGLKFCFPRICLDDKEILDLDGFDLALAKKHVALNLPVVCNDFSLHGPERIIVVSGPNQGGKTTFARAFGQLHYLASLGLPVPGREAKLFLCDAIFTHFEKEEDIRNLRGKLQDDLVRIYEILAQSTAKSIVILNEIFTSTTIKDAVFLSEKIMEKITGLDLLCVWVTFIDELASYNEKTLSMVSMVEPENPVIRTFKVVRKPADGLAYAISIAEKYRLTYACLKERIKP